MRLHLLATLTALLTVLLPTYADTLPQTPTTIYNVVYTASTGQNFIQFAGTMIVPHLPHAGFYYLWPGLFLPDYGGVLQPVLSGGTGQWTINNTWYYVVNEDPAGAQDVRDVAFGVQEGDGMRFDMRINNETGIWSITLSVPGTNKTATNEFPMILPKKAYNIPYAVFEIELWSQQWDFGSLTFTDISMVANGTTSTSWCNDRPATLQTSFNASGVNFTVQDKQVTCNIQSMVLLQPGANASAQPTEDSPSSAGKVLFGLSFWWLLLGLGAMLTYTPSS
ncbi:hypothetical protein FB45DRAFT_932677 [Roridomyces roridus]|uniref:Uncharacterized protein n=1 Tax=Roridomyces roridus TaxID=1738132 RepID=A0AAD7BD17_9AGAR|nr:hypothetical protein FB45DRAFT_932677 [Roridomyces roridus]